MPLLLIHSSVVPQSPVVSANLLKTLSSTLAQELNKPERYVMVVLAPTSTISFSNTLDPALYAELKNVGQLSNTQIEHLSHVLCKALSNTFAIPFDRIYIEFTNVNGALWGWNGGTFA